jgi:hypothetical protein
LFFCCCTQLQQLLYKEASARVELSLPVRAANGALRFVKVLAWAGETPQRFLRWFLWV